MLEKIEIPVSLKSSSPSAGSPPDLRLSYAFSELAHQCITDRMISSSSNQRETLQSLIDLSQDSEQRVLYAAVNEPIYPAVFNGLKVTLTDILGRAPTNEDLSRFSLPPRFKIDIKRAFGRRGLDLSTLEEIHSRSLVHTLVPELLQSLIRMKDQCEQFPFREMFKLMKENIGNSKLGFPTTTSGDLYILTLMPAWLRYVAQDLIATETLIHKMRTMCSANESEISERIDRIAEYLRGMTLCGERWSLLAKNSKCEELQEEIVALRMRGLHQLKGIADLLSTEGELGPMKKAIVLYNQSQKVLMDEVTACYRKSTCKGWENTDIGHAFRHFSDFQFDMAIENPYSKTIGEKDGSFAVILEDTDQQLTDWAHLITRCSPRTLLPDGRSLCTSPEQLDEQIENPKVDLFLLDIQNPQNPIAGIETAERILRARALWTDRSDITAQSRTKIVVWSYSIEALAQAERHLDRVVDELDPTRKKISGFGMYSSDNMINIVIHSKFSEEMYLSIRSNN